MGGCIDRNLALIILCYILYYTVYLHLSYILIHTILLHIYTIDLRALSLYHEAAISAGLPPDLSLTCVDPGRLAVEAPLGLGTGLGQAEAPLGLGTGLGQAEGCAQVEVPFTDLRTLPEDMYEMLDTLGTCMRCG